MAVDYQVPKTFSKAKPPHKQQQHTEEINTLAFF